MKRTVNCFCKKLLLTVLTVLSFWAIAQAQNVTVTGTVTGDDGEPIPGANIVLKGTTIGTISGASGDYSIEAPANGTLTYSFIGYEAQEIAINGKSKIDVEMQLSSIGIEEVVAIGYGTVRKKEVTGAVAQVSSDVLQQSATSDLGTALQGQIAGVSVQASSGSPGASSNIQIRGLSSVTGTNAPLFVVDGIPYDGDPKLSNSEIETIDVLKDAASAAIYGTRGSGGVILITTKQGKAGTMKVGVDSYYGIQDITSGTPILNFEETFFARFIWANNINGTHYDNTWSALESNRYQFTNSTDLEEVLVVDNAAIQNHSINISGGKAGLTYNVVANYFSQDGSIINSGYERFNVRANTNYVKDKWTFKTSLGFYVEEKESEPWQLLLEAYKYKPYQTAVDPDAEIIQDGGNAGSNEAVGMSNLMAKLKQTDVRDGDQFNGSLQAEYQLHKNVKVTSRVGASYNNNTRVRINPLFKAYDNEGDLIPMQVRSGVYNYSDRSHKFTWENTINFDKKFGAHRVRALGVFSTESYSFTSFFAQKFDLLSNDITVLNGATLDPNAGSGTGWGQDKTNSLVGILGRLQYDYKGRYLLSVSARRDGSSRFSEKYRWGTFPSVSAGWNVSDEAWWSGLRNTVNGFKIRASYGTTGNQNFLDYSNASGITLEKDYVFGPEEADRLVLGATQTAFSNKNVKWETTIQRNIGFDMAFFNNKLTFTGDFYNTDKEDMLFPLLVPPSTGAGQNATVILNVGNMNNKGYEFAANYRHNGKVSWYAGLTYSKNVNEITKMSGSNKIAYMQSGTVVDGVPNSDRVTVITEGYEAGAFFVMETDGLIRSEADLLKYQELVPTAKLGDLRYVDQNKDGLLTDDDRIYAGSGAPEFEMGLNLGADYKGVDLSMQWYGSFGNEIINGTEIYTYMHGTHKDMLYQWTTQNVNSDIPANRGRDHWNYRGYTDYWIEDGSFIRLRNVTLGYTLPKNLVKKAGLDKLRIYVAAQNPITITDYKGFDPEVGNDGLSSRGIDKGNYPISRQWRAGVQFDF
ncbi:TonB-dependent receptor [uncultured Draconibacterium sp.]|uniref:SusC/RagA family TonB-linked outer membrane protein n=1 Tax=uncultured Draconibacterium sp. TaxID=1573823 RepID=UPI0025E84A33|nr:TonB-dependent receptor [uncultured Draconibacterium sp.]